MLLQQRLSRSFPPLLCTLLPASPCQTLPLPSFPHCRFPFFLLFSLPTKQLSEREMLLPLSSPLPPHPPSLSPLLHILPVTVRPPDKSLQGQPNFEGQDKALAYGPIPRCLPLSPALSPSPLGRDTWEAQYLFLFYFFPLSSPQVMVGVSNQQGMLFPLQFPSGGRGSDEGKGKKQWCFFKA